MALSKSQNHPTSRSASNSYIMSLSLEHFLSPHLISPEECRRRYWSGLALSGRLLGDGPVGFYQIIDLSPLTTDALAGLLRQSFRLPACELGFTVISPRQRRIACLEGSRTHGTPYCTSHCAAMGDMLNGPLVQQCIRAGGLASLQTEEQEGDALIKKLVQEACSFPASIAPATKQAFVDKFGEQGLLEVTTIVSFMGWLNFCNDIAGMELERGIAPFSELVLSPHELPSRVEYKVAEHGDATKAERDVSLVSRGNTSGLWSRFQAYMRNAWSLATVMPAFVDSDLAERALFKGIPTKASCMDEWMLCSFGCSLRLFEDISDIVVLRLLAFGCKEVFLRDKISTWKRFEKYAFLYVFGKRVGTSILAEDAITLLTADRMLEKKLSTTPGLTSHELWNPTKKKVREEFEGLYTDAASGEEATGAFSAALKFILAAAGHAGGVSEPVMREALAKVDSPGAVVDLVGISGMFAYLHRTYVFLKAR